MGQRMVGSRASCARAAVRTGGAGVGGHLKCWELGPTPGSHLRCRSWAVSITAPLRHSTGGVTHPSVGPRVGNRCHRCRRKRASWLGKQFFPEDSAISMSAIQPTCHWIRQRQSLYFHTVGGGAWRHPSSPSTQSREPLEEGQACQRHRVG